MLTFISRYLQLILVIIIVYLVSQITANKNVTFILGGVEKIYLNDQPSSPLLNSFEIYGCDGQVSNHLLVSIPCKNITMN